MTWDEYFINLCYEIASKSKDRSTKVGCVIVGPDNEIRTTGYNGFPRGLDDTMDAWHERPLKYKLTEHSERNAIYNAARCGIPLKGCRLYVPWHPCSDCARAVIQSGVVSVHLDPKFEMPKEMWDRWKDDLDIASLLFRETGVPVLGSGDF